jgi:CheY-like chemotaxis protein
LVDKLREQPQFAEIPILIVSAADPHVEIPRAQAKGLAGFIGKPIDAHLFPDQVLSCMNGAPIWYAPPGMQALYL